ncbi:hypothetical protein AB0D08_27865 [Kitasatospora sp. NPDC048540]|uniref:hypothetical protein n=1 Tax=unclassified Kitasatospora TaxID=2633591 RepID=UPI001314DD05|nr:hypothetical protein [Kitasatospora sp. MBT63]
MPSHDPATLAVATSVAGYRAAGTAIALTAIAALTRARLRGVPALLVLLLGRRA